MGYSGRMSGPPPKDPSKRARRNADPIGTTVLTFVPGEQPSLPRLESWNEELGAYVIRDWHAQTVIWWEMWRQTKLAETFTATDWSFLLDTAKIHHDFWSGDMKAAPELRLRVAKFGATPEDRARLRIVFADADEKDGKRGSTTGETPQKAYGNLRAVKPTS